MEPSPAPAPSSTSTPAPAAAAAPTAKRARPEDDNAVPVPNKVSVSNVLERIPVTIYDDKVFFSLELPLVRAQFGLPTPAKPDRRGKQYREATRDHGIVPDLAAKFTTYVDENIYDERTRDLSFKQWFDETVEWRQENNLHHLYAVFVPHYGNYATETEKMFAVLADHDYKLLASLLQAENDFGMPATPAGGAPFARTSQLNLVPLIGDLIENETFGLPRTKLRAWNFDGGSHPIHKALYRFFSNVNLRR